MGALKVMGHSIERIFNSQTMRLSCTVFEIVSNFDPPHLHLAPPVEFCGNFWRLALSPYSHTYCHTYYY